MTVPGSCVPVPGWTLFRHVSSPWLPVYYSYTHFPKRYRQLSQNKLFLANSTVFKPRRGDNDVQVIWKLMWGNIRKYITRLNTFTIHLLLFIGNMTTNTSLVVRKKKSLSKLVQEEHPCPHPVPVKYKSVAQNSTDGISDSRTTLD